MKKTIFLLTMLVLSATLSGQSLLDRPAAKIKLYETEIISSKKVNQNVALLEANTGSALTIEKKKEVLNSMIDTALVLQAARRDGKEVTDLQVKQYAIAKFSQSVGVQLNEQQFEELLKQQLAQNQLRGRLQSEFSNLKVKLGRDPSELEINNVINPILNSAIAEYLAAMKSQLTIQNYISFKGDSQFKSIPEPSDREIQAEYAVQEEGLLNPPMKRVSHIFFPTIVKNGQTPSYLSPSEKELVHSNAESILRDLKNGVITYEAAVREHSEDPDSKTKIGDIGYLTRKDQNAIQSLGQNFIDTVFTMTLHQFQIIESNVGYHIVKVTEDLPKKFLSLDDPINPMQIVTVREKIVNELMSVKQQELFQVISMQIVKELREEDNSEVTLYLQNLGWE